MNSIPTNSKAPYQRPSATVLGQVRDLTQQPIGSNINIIAG